MINSTSTEVASPFSASARSAWDPGLGAPPPGASPPANIPATSTAPIETHQRIAVLPYHAMVTRKSGRAKPEGGAPFTFRLVARKDARAWTPAIQGDGTGLRITGPQQTSAKTGRSTGRNEPVELRSFPQRTLPHDRRGHQTQDQGPDQDRTTAPAQGDPGQ